MTWSILHLSSAELDEAQVRSLAIRALALTARHWITRNGGWMRERMMLNDWCINRDVSDKSGVESIHSFHVSGQQLYETSPISSSHEKSLKIRCRLCDLATFTMTFSRSGWWFPVWRDGSRRNVGQSYVQSCFCWGLQTLVHAKPNRGPAGTFQSDQDLDSALCMGLLND